MPKASSLALTLALLAGSSWGWTEIARTTSDGADVWYISEAEMVQDRPEMCGAWVAIEATRPVVDVAYRSEEYVLFTRGAYKIDARNGYAADGTPVDDTPPSGEWERTAPGTAMRRAEAACFLLAGK